MSDGPIDYSSGHIFESQKGISDRRAARGLDRGGSSGFTDDSPSGTGGGDAVQLIGLVLFWVLAAVVWMAGQSIKLAVWLLIAAISKRR